MITVSGLNVHPLKSGSGTAVASAGLLATGLRHDREFMLVDAARRAFLSQRKHPRMALLRTAYDGVELDVNDFRLKPSDEGEVLDVTLHGKHCAGVDQGDEAAAYFSDFLGLSVRLVRFTGERHTARGGGRVLFNDGYPIMVMSRESLDDLNTRLPEPVPMDRFRPNIVLSGLGPYGEDGVRLLRFEGGAELEFVKPCGRCVLTTVDQDSGVKGREPLATLAKYRTIRWGDERLIAFGQNAIPRVTGTLHVGQSVEVVEYAA